MQHILKGLLDKWIKWLLDFWKIGIGKLFSC